MGLAFLYSVYWNLFNVSVDWTNSHVPPLRGDLGPSPGTSYWESGHKTLCGLHAKRCGGRGETRP